MLGPRRTLTGEPLEPVLACTALAQTHGLINGEHVKVVRETMNHLPAAVDAVTRSQIEADLARTAISVALRNSRTTPTAPCFCSIRTDPNPTRPSASAGAGCGKARKAATR